MAIPPGLNYVDTVWKYFSPSRSPFYAIISVAAYSLCWAQTMALPKGSREAEISVHQFYGCIIPMFVALVIVLYFALKTSYSLPKQVHDEQILFARSFSISVALICLVANASLYNSQNPIMIGIYTVPILQLSVFILYLFSRLKKEQPPSQSNLIQLALITATFLIGFSYCLHLPSLSEASGNPPSTDFNGLYFSGIPVVSWALFALWILCMCKWLRHLINTVKITINIADDETPDPLQQNTGVKSG
jgi:hypothetical protein